MNKRLPIDDSHISLIGIRGPYSHIVDFLLNNGYEVVVITHSPSPAPLLCIPGVCFKDSEFYHKLFLLFLMTLIDRTGHELTHTPSFPFVVLWS